MKISAIDIIKAHKQPNFKSNKHITKPYEMDIFESCEPKPFITKKSVIKGTNTEEVNLKPNVYESSLGIFKTRKVLNSKIGKLEGTFPLEVKISDSEIDEASRFKGIEVLQNVQAGKLQSISDILLSGNNTIVNEANTSLMTVYGSKVNVLNCESLTAKDALINSAYVKGHSTRDKKQFLDIDNTKIGILNINPDGEYQLNNSHICKIVIPEHCRKISFYPSVSLFKNGDSVIGAFENNSKHNVTIEFYKDGKFIRSKITPPNTCYNTEAMEEFFEE